MTYEVDVEHTFCAAHQLRLPDGTLEPVHGHNWRVVVTFAARELDAVGCVVDFHWAERALRAAVAPWENAHLNACAPFSEGRQPSAELVARTIMERVPGAARVSVSEAPGCVARVIV